MTTTAPPQKTTLHWFRRGLRLKDNPSLVEAVSTSKALYPVYVLDGDSYQLLHCTALRANFLVECLQDLDQRLRAKGSRLYVAKGDPIVVLPELWSKWEIDCMTYDEDETGQTYATERDTKVRELALKHKIEVKTFCSETLFPLKDYVKAAGGLKNVPNSMTGFQKVFQKNGSMAEVLEEPDRFPSSDHHKVSDAEYPVPRRPTDLPWPRSISKDKATPQWDAEDCKKLTPIVHGGETLALKQLESTVTAKPTYVATFEKPKTSCTSLNPSTTVLSPYLSWGCLSPRVAWNAVHEAAQRSNKPTTSPPVSLKGQLLWRDFNHLMAHTAPGTWGQMKGNPHCRTIPWDDDKERLEAWKTGKTGFPWIDACMMQLKQEGWVHHLGRHAVACFLTRGDLWQSWEEGALHFESQLLDADYALNGFNWLWLSCSGFFYQYFRCYSPIAFQKKNDPSGTYIRKYLPILKKLPDKYIYEPWTAPIAVQRTAGVIIGKDYPNPIVDHAKASKENMSRMKEAYDAFKAEEEALKGNSHDKKRSRDEESGSKRKQRQS